MNIEADLHIHTKSSDGLLDAEDIVEIAAKKGLKAIAITDHDSVESVESAKVKGVMRGVYVIPGVEISCDYKGEEVHILGYFIDYRHHKLKKILTKLRSSRVDRFKRMVELANSFGFKINAAELLLKSGQHSPGRAHVGRALVNHGYATSMEEAFNKYLYPGGPLYVSRYKLLPAYVISLIKEISGLAVLAHPGLIKKRELIYELIASGLDGLEVVHPLHSEDDNQQLESLAVKENLLLTVGSDFHGEESSAEILGMYGVPMLRIEKMEAVKKNRNL